MALWGRASDLIEQTHCVRADWSMCAPPTTPPLLDAMHFHSGTSCCSVQSGPGAEVNLFTSSAAETKEQWERLSEHSERYTLSTQGPSWWAIYVQLAMPVQSRKHHQRWPFTLMNKDLQYTMNGARYTQGK